MGYCPNTVAQGTTLLLYYIFPLLWHGDMPLLLGKGIPPYYYCTGYRPSNSNIHQV